MVQEPFIGQAHCWHLFLALMTLVILFFKKSHWTYNGMMLPYQQMIGAAIVSATERHVQRTSVIPGFNCHDLEVHGIESPLDGESMGSTLDTDLNTRPSFYRALDRRCLGIMPRGATPV